MNRPSPHLLALVVIQVMLGALASTAEPAVADVPRMVMYDVTDLLTPSMADFIPVYEPRQQPALPLQPVPSAAAKLDAFLRANFESGVAELIASQSRMLDGCTVAVTGADALQRHFEETLSRIRRQQMVQFRFEAKQILMDPRIVRARYALPQLTWHDLPGPGGHAFATMDAQLLAGILAAVAKDPDAVIAERPALTIRNGQCGISSIVQQLAYQGMRHATADPDLGVQVTSTGWSFSARATASDDRRFVHLVLDQEVSSLMSLATIDLGPQQDGEPASAEEPVVWRGHIHFDRALPAGEALLITTGLILDKALPPRAGFLAVTTTLIDASELEKRQ